ncbi:MAG TPA: response regulator [Terracidiphilus sp.]|jgi:two-component system chemotaxis response regulator CheY|nr:response regulator [Terracidiphilus sp.]
MRALIVDDSRFSRRLLSQMLEREGMTGAEAADAEAGLELLRSQPGFDLLLVDWNMPGISGPEMIARARQEGMLGLKILMVTTVAESECILEALDAGADEFLMKPFDAEGLREKLALMGLERVAG